MEKTDGGLPILESGLLCAERFRTPLLVSYKQEDFIIAVIDGEPYIYRASMDLLRLIRLSDIRIRQDMPIHLLPNDFYAKRHETTLNDFT